MECLNTDESCIENDGRERQPMKKVICSYIFIYPIYININIYVCVFVCVYTVCLRRGAAQC